MRRTNEMVERICICIRKDRKYFGLSIVICKGSSTITVGSR